MRAAKNALAALTALALGACASTSQTETPPVDLSGYELSELHIPDRLPAPTEPLGFLRPDADGGPDDIEIVLTPYTVTASTPEAMLRGEDGILSHVTDGDQSFVARVDWSVRWTYDYVRVDGLCRAENAQTRLTVTYTLPDWAPTDVPPAGLADYWARFEDRLWMHEYGHARIGYEAKGDIRAALESSDLSDEDCSVLGTRLNALGRAITQRGLDAEYDARTGHGRTQGAVFSLSEARAAIRQTEPNEGES